MRAKELAAARAAHVRRADSSLEARNEKLIVRLYLVGADTLSVPSILRRLHEHPPD